MAAAQINESGKTSQNSTSSSRDLKSGGQGTGDFRMRFLCFRLTNRKWLMVGQVVVWLGLIQPLSECSMSTV